MNLWSLGRDNVQMAIGTFFCPSDEAWLTNSPNIVAYSTSPNSNSFTDFSELGEICLTFPLYFKPRFFGRLSATTSTFITELNISFALYTTSRPSLMRESFKTNAGSLFADTMPLQSNFLMNYFMQFCRLCNNW